MKFLRGRKGFTLIELMIVVVIIGILAALAIPRFMQASKKAKMSEARTVLKQVYQQSAVYYEETGGWPVAEGDGWLNEGWAAVGIDAPSGNPRFCYKFINADADAEPGTELAQAIGAATDGCTGQTADASLVNVLITVDNSGVIIVDAE